MVYPHPPQRVLKKTALFIGRFQPFHKGHLSVIKNIYSKYNHIIIGIGSAEDNYLPKNPFTAGERYEMIRVALATEGFNLSKISIIPVRNINNYALWVRHIELILPKFDVVYTGSSIVKNLFDDYGQYQIISIKQELEINATQIRQKMFEGKDWKKFVPKSVFYYLKEIKNEKRIKIDIQK